MEAQDSTAINTEIQKFTKILETNPTHKNVLALRAEQYLKQKNYLKCMADCQAALKIDENMIRACVYLAACYVAIGDKEKAGKYLSHAKQFDKEDEIRYLMCHIREWETCLEASGYEKLLEVQEFVQEGLESIHALIGKSIEKDRREFIEREETGKKAKDAKTVTDANGKVKTKKWVRCKDGKYRNPDEC